MSTVFIINPRVGGSGYTSEKAAQELVRRGRARWESPDEIVIVKRDRHQATSIDPDALWWNGSTGAFKMHLPGEVRS